MLELLPSNRFLKYYTDNGVIITSTKWKPSENSTCWYKKSRNSD